jgi:16S rRNA (uracil1498-N3)-methyltransferase
MRLHRFYVQQPLGEELHIDNKELVHQWFSVFRYRENDSVLLFSFGGEYKDYHYSFVAINKKEATLRLIEKKDNVRPSHQTLLFVALVKKEAFETIIRQATELLITDIVPIVSARSEKKSFNEERLYKIMRESGEQCGRGDIPMLHKVLSFEEALLLAKKTHIIGDTGATLHEKNTVARYDGVWVGPEGGWTPEEIASAKEKGITPIRLSHSILRADTAATALITYTLL